MALHFLWTNILRNKKVLQSKKDKRIWKNKIIDEIDKLCNIMDDTAMKQYIEGTK